LEEEALPKTPRGAISLKLQASTSCWGDAGLWLYAPNSRGLTLQNVRLQVRSPEMRPAVIFEDVAVNGLSVQANPAAESALRLINSKQILLTASRLLSSAAVFLQLEGAEKREYQNGWR
jgi:hypothetical protein